MRKVIALIIIFLGVAADQLMKAWTVGHLEPGQSQKFLPHILSLTYVQNNGAAWSSFAGQQWIFQILTPIVLIVALYFLWKKISLNWYFIGLSLIVSGALGNFIDRLRQAFVIDMFQTDFINFPIFNIADSLLTIGFILLFIAILTEKEDKAAEK